MILDINAHLQMDKLSNRVAVMVWLGRKRDVTC